MNRWFFWVLAPVALGGALIIAATAEPRGVTGRMALVGVVSGLLLGTLGLANPVRYRWALKGVAALVVAAGLSYFVVELAAWWAGKPVGLSGHRSSASLFNATLFLLAFGLPAVRFLVSGRSESLVDDLVEPGRHGHDEDDDKGETAG
jgi:hypothetical protein